MDCFPSKASGIVLKRSCEKQKCAAPVTPANLTADDSWQQTKPMALDLVRTNRKPTVFHNQTPAAWRSLEPSERRSGLFYFDGSTDFGTPWFTHLEDSTYEVCVKEGGTSNAFKWIPHRVA